MKQPVTVYTRGDFFGNFFAVPGTLVEFGHRKHAQYNHAPFVDFIPKGKRKPVRHLTGHRPMILVLAGHGHPDPDPMMLPADAAGTSRSRYSSFDTRWTTDFNALINPYIAARPGIVLFDARWTTSADLAVVDPQHAILFRDDPITCEA